VSGKLCALDVISGLFAGSELTCHETPIFSNRLVPSICHLTIHHLFTTHSKHAPYFPRDSLAASGKELRTLSFLGHFLSPLPALFCPTSVVSQLLHLPLNHDFPPTPWLQSRRRRPQAMMLVGMTARVPDSNRSKPGLMFTEKPNTVCTRKTMRIQRLVMKSGRGLSTLMACISGTQHWTFGKSRHRA
jgi:hypothetical protein